MTRGNEFLAGVKAELPILLGVIPFGLIFGVVALQAGLPAWPAMAMSSVVFAGSAQFIGVQLFGLATPAVVILLTTLVVNLRHLLYGASLGPFLKPLRPAWKWLLAYLMTDEAYAVAIVRYATETGSRKPEAVTDTGLLRRSAPRNDRTGERLDNRHWFFLGAGLTLWVAWQVSTAVGILLGAQIPQSWSLDFALPLTFIALVRPTLTDRPAVLAAGAAGVIAVLAVGLPYKLGLVLAAISGIVVGLVSERE